MTIEECFKHLLTATCTKNPSKHNQNDQILDNITLPTLPTFEPK